MRHVLSIICFLALMATGAAAELEVSAPETVSAGASIPVHIARGIEKGDQVTIGTADGEPIPEAQRAYPTTSLPETQIAAPVEPGDYTVVVLRANTPVATRPIKVAPPSATVVPPERAAMREQIEIRFEGPGNPGDHLTYVEADGTRLLYVPRGYTNDRKEGAVKMAAPEKPGEYRVAYITGGKVLASTPIQVTGASAHLVVPERVGVREPFEVTVEGPANPGDFLTLGDAKGAPLALGTKVYLRGKKRDTLKMTSPQQEGDFTVVYQSGVTVIAAVPLKAESPQAPK